MARHVASMTIDDVDHYTAEQRGRIVADLLPHEREARAHGIPVLGSGRVFPVPEESIRCEPIPIPPHWVQINGLDFGWDHPFGAVNCAWDRDADVFYDGQRAVAHVLWNRVRDGRWGKTLATVCLARMQFSCWNASDPNREHIAAVADHDPILRRLRSVLGAARSEADPTGGATHYFSTFMIQPPKWSIGATFCGTFGRHRFYKDVK